MIAMKLMKPPANITCWRNVSVRGGRERGLSAEESRSAESEAIRDPAAEESGRPPS